MDYPIVYIEWSDSFGTWSWGPLEDVLEIAPSACRSVGFLVADTDSHVTLVTSLGPEDSGNGSITIPKGCVTDRHEIAGVMGDDRWVCKI